MSKIAIKDWQGRVQGYIDERPNGDKYVSDWRGVQQGRYIKAQDVTKDFYGRVIAKGDMASALIKFD